MPRYDKIPTYLNPEQRQAFLRVPPDLSDREIACYYTFTEKERELINRRRRDSNRLGFAVQLALLRFPGRTLMEVKEVPRAVLTVIADQLGVAASTFADYGERENTLYEHLDELRRECGFRSCGWKESPLVARELLGDAMESDRPLPLIETALERLRSEGIIAPNLIHVERLVWIVLKLAERKLFRILTGSLSLEQRTRLDGLLFAETDIRGATRLSWLRQAPGVSSPKSVKQIIDRLLFLRSLELPTLPTSLHQNRVLQLALKASRYRAQPLLKFKSARRHALDGDTIAPNYYEAAAFEALKGRVRSGDVAVGGGRRYRSFESDLLPPAHFAQLTEKQQTRLVVDDNAQSYLLLEVDNWTGFLRHFTHLTSGDAPVGTQKLELVAALMGMGMNLGLGKMAEVCPYTYRQLSWSVDWHIREETLLAALASLDNFVLNSPLSPAWGDGTTSSSDGMRVIVGVHAANAEYNAKHFGVRRGVTMYSHAADIWVPFGKQQVISTNDREALYVIDALCHHESDLHIQEHYTDIGGFTDHVFALTALLCFRFAPRTRDALFHHLNLLEDVGEYGPLNTQLFGQVKSKLIIEQWDEMRRVASSIRHGTVSASLLMRKLAAYPRQNQVARAHRDGEAGAYLVSARLFSR